MVVTTAELRSDCLHAAELLGFPVPCPTLLPEAVDVVRCEVPGDFAYSNVTPKEGCALGEGFILAPNTNVPHLMILGAREEARSDCSNSLPHVSASVQGHRAVMIDCPSTAGLVADHVLLTWSLEGIAFGVTAHGHTAANRKVVQDVADAVQLVKPEAAN